MRKLLLFIAALFLGSSLGAQQATFSKVYYDSLQSGTQVNAIVPANGGSFLVAGFYSSRDGLAFKIDSIGNRLWSKTYHYSTLTFPSIRFSAAAPTYGSCFILAGTAYDSVSGFLSALCMKIDANGDTIWSKVIEKSGHYIEILSINETHDSGYVMTGYADLSGPPYAKLFIAKMDKAGVLLWSNFFTAGNNGDYGHSVKETPDSGFVVCGGLNSIPGSFLIKLNKTGSVLWSKKYIAGTNPCYFHDFVIMNNGYYLYGYAGPDLVLLKTDFNGNIQWQKNWLAYSGGYFINASQPKLHRKSANEYYFILGTCGGSYSFKVDSTGNIIWAQNLTLNAMDMLETKDAGYLVAGNGPMCAIKLTNLTIPHIGLIKTDSLGNESSCVFSSSIPPDMDLITASVVSFTNTPGAISKSIRAVPDTLLMGSFAGCVGWTGSIEDADIADEFLIYPTPAEKEFRIECKNSTERTLFLFDVTGTLLKKAVFGGNSITISVHDLPSGLYFARIITHAGSVVKKVVIQH